MSEAAPDLSLQKFIDYETFAKDMKIDETNLSASMKAHGPLYAYYATQAVKAKRQLEVQSLKLEIIESTLDKEWRAILKEENPKTTEAQVAGAVRLDARYAAAKMREINAKEIAETCRFCASSFDQQKDMLLQIARDAARESG